MNSKILKGILLALTAAIFWGISGTLGQFLFQNRGINVEWLITTRMLTAGICLLIFSKYKENSDLFSVWKSKNDARQLLTFSIFGMLAVQYTYFAAIKHSNAATATILQYSGPIMIAIFLAFKHRKFPIPVELAAIGLTVIGVFLLVTHADIKSLSISGVALFLGLSSAVTLAIYTLQPAELLEKYNSSLIIGWGMFIGGVFFSFVKAPWSIEGIWDAQTYFYTFFIILFGTLIAFYFYLTAVKILGGQKTSLLASAEPLAATVLAVIWLKIPFSGSDWAGSICIISTVFLLARKE